MANEYLSESPVELALRFADLGGSSVMSKTLADEIRRIRGIVLKELEFEESLFKQLGGIESTSSEATRAFIVAAINTLQRQVREHPQLQKLEKETRGLLARLAASRTERDKLHGDKVRMLAAIDGALASLRPYMETRGAPFPLANAMVIRVHSFSESSDVPGSCAMCGWPERSQVHGEAARVPHKYVSATEEYPGSGPGQCATCGSGEWDSIHDQHRGVPSGVAGPDGELVTVKAIEARTTCECGHPSLNHEYHIGACSQCACTRFLSPPLIPMPASDDTTVLQRYGSASTVLNSIIDEANEERAAQADEAMEKTLDRREYDEEHEQELLDQAEIKHGVPVTAQDLEEHDESIQAEMDNREDEDDRRPL